MIPRQIKQGSGLEETPHMSSNGIHWSTLDTGNDRLVLISYRRHDPGMGTTYRPRLISVGHSASIYHIDWLIHGQKIGLQTHRPSIAPATAKPVLQISILYYAHVQQRR